MNALSFQEHFHSRGLTDGLPVMPPTQEAVSECLVWALLPPEHVVGVEPVRERVVTAEKVAINAVIAGRLPQHFPLVAASISAVLHPDFLLHGATASTSGCGILLVVNGPVRQELGMSSSFNALWSSKKSLDLHRSRGAATLAQPSRCAP